MTAKIINFPMESPEDVLGGIEAKSVVICWFDHEEGEHFAAAGLTTAQALWLLERCKQRLIEG